MKVSVITPTYNRLHLLKIAIASFMSQDYDNAELIILDDGCTDGTTDYLATLNNPNIKIITRRKNVLKGGLNELWNHATGDLICQLHDDDFLTPDSLSIRVEPFKKYPILDVVYGGANLINASGKLTSVYPGEAPDIERLLKTDYINFTTLMWRRELPFRIDDDFEFNLDWMFKIRCLKELNCGYITEPVMNYRTHQGQETHRSRLSGAHDKEMVVLKEKLKILYGI